MGFGWDVDDDVFDEDEDDVDDEHPFGDDEDFDEDDVYDEDKEEEQSGGQRGNASKKQKTDDQDEKTTTGKQDDGKTLDKKKADPIAMKGEAKSNNMPELIFPMCCPICKQKSLFSDPVNAAGKRISVTMALACVGMINVDAALSSVHLRCMNKECKSYWKKTGEYFLIKPTGTLEKKKSIFHIDK